MKTNQESINVDTPIIIQGIYNQMGVKSIKESNNIFFYELGEIEYKKRAVQMIIHYLNNNYKDNVTLDKLSNKVNYSGFHLIRLFKKETGKTPFEYLGEIRISKAKNLLKNSSKSITNICFEAGFNNRSYFSSIFKKKVGVAPTEYRKLHLK